MTYRFGRVGRLARELQLVRKAFRNWPVVAIAGLLWRHLPLPQRDLVLVTRNGTRFVAPLGRKAGALYPALEVFAFLAYDDDWGLEPAPYVIDVGAQIGAFTLWLAEEYPGLRGVCFEPDPEAFRYLEKNVGGVDVVARPDAVAAHTGSSTLVRPIPGGGVSSLRRGPRQPGPNVVEVAVLAFDELMADIREPVALVKLDCEGSEYEIVLKSAPESWRRVRRVVIEYHPLPGQSPSALVHRLESFELSLVREQSSAVGVGTYWFSRA